MRLRIRLQDELRDRMAAHLPEAMGTVWDHAAVVLVIERLDLKPAGGVMDGWQRAVSFSGTVLTELRADRIDALPVEALLANLVEAPMTLAADAGPPVGAYSETCRAVVLDLRDTLRDQAASTAIRLSITGDIVRRVADLAVPQAWIGAAPQIGPEHVDTYSPIGGI